MFFRTMQNRRRFFRRSKPKNVLTKGYLNFAFFFQVFKVRSKEDGRIYAVKKSIETFRSAADRMQKLSEVQKHEQLPKHPNLVQFVKAWEERGCLYIQTELCKTK